METIEVLATIVGVYVVIVALAEMFIDGKTWP